MAEDAKLQIILEALVGEFKASLQQAVGVVQQSTTQMQGQVQTSTKQMENSFKTMGNQVTGSLKDIHGQMTGFVGNISSLMGRLGVIMAGVGAVLAGGAWFKSAISSYTEFIGEAKKLRETIGGNVNDAAALNFAFKRVGVGTDDLQQIFISLRRQLKNQEEGMNEAGVATRNADGTYRSYTDILFQGIDILRKTEEGVDRSQRMMDIFGMRARISGGALRIMIDDVARAKTFLEGLGMTIGPEMEAQLLKFRAGMVDTQMVFTAVNFQIARTVLPALTSLGQWFAGEGKTAVQGFIGLLVILGNTLYYIGQAAKFAMSAAAGVAAVHGGEVYKERRLTIPPPKAPELPEAPDLEKYTGRDKGGAGGTEANLRKLETIIQQLNQQLAQLGEGSLAGIREWANKVRAEIMALTGDAESQKIALGKLDEAEKAKEKKLEDDFAKWYSGAMHDRLAQVEARYEDELKKVRGIKEAEVKLEQWKAAEIKKVNSEMQLEGMNLLKGQLEALAGAVPLLSQQLPLKARILELDIQIANATLLKELADKPHLAHLRDELLALQALTAQEKRYALEIEQAGNMHTWALGRIKEGETAGKTQTSDIMKSLEKGISSTLSRGIIGALRGKKVDLAEIGWGIAEAFINKAVEMAVAKLFVAFAQGFLESSVPMVTAATITAETLTAAGAPVAAEMIAGATTTAGILTTAGATVAAEMIAGATTAAGILRGGGGGGGGDIIGGALSFIGGLFHSGGIVMHEGGVLTAHGGLRLDERLVRARVGEWILNPDAARALQARGGPSTFNNLNAGNLPGVLAGGGGKTQIIHLGGQTNNLNVRELDLPTWKRFQGKAMRSMAKAARRGMGGWSWR